MGDITRRSIEIILNNQASSGAYPACPTFPTYRYSWFRDGSFIAYAMDLVGEHESARHFFDWAASVITAREGVIQHALEKSRSNERLGNGEILHTRYTVDGDEADDEWPNFQLDGFGTLLWAMGQHQEITQSSPPETWRKAISLVAVYLSALWRQPCYDCWEEFPEKVHPHTLAAIRAGLLTSQSLLDTDHQATIQELSDLLMEDAIVGGHFVKSIGTDFVDASLLGLALPYQLLPLDDPRTVATVALIEDTLQNGGGVHRYTADTYYGGGEWVLLTAWLGWYHAQRGDRKRALEIKHWIETQADEQGYLPEQIPATLIDAGMYQPWVDRWGEIARPLLWSHAKYLILSESLKK
jgi:GH15 family glucan-1,4-alpha-glucosidase